MTNYNKPVVRAQALYIDDVEITATAAELNKVDGVTAGTALVSSVVVLDANKAIDEVNTAKLSIGVSGSETEVTSTAAELNILDGVTADKDEINVLDEVTAGTATASKAVVLDANSAVDAVKTAALHIGVSGSEVEVVATPAEINRTCDVSTRTVSLTATAAITETLHEGKVCVITGTDAAAYTLPEATGSGAIYRFIINEVNTSGNVFHTADATDCAFYGSANILDLDAAAQAAYAPAATDELMTLNGTTTSGAIGDYVQFVDIATDKWCVFAQLQCPTSSNPSTPFSGA